MEKDRRQVLALFDFDGTITTRDTMLEFLRYCRGDIFYWTRLLMLSPILIAFKLGFIPNWRAKEVLLGAFFKGWPVQLLREKGIAFCREKVAAWIRPAAIKQLKAHQQAGERVVLITASADLWVAEWCRQMGVEYLATQLAVENGKLTGKLEGRNCYGPEKVNRLLDHLSIIDFQPIYAYGDSVGDREMLALANFPNYKPFRKG